MFGVRTIHFWLAITTTSFLACAQNSRVGAFGASNVQPVQALRSLTRPFAKNIGECDFQAAFCATGSVFSVALKRSGVTLYFPGSSNKPIEFEFVGAERESSIEGETPTGISNIFQGNDPRRWFANIPTYGQVRQSNLYAGIDLLYHARWNGSFKSDFIVAPGADPAKIRVTVSGVHSIQIDQGDLVMLTDDGEVRQQKPRAYQTVGDLEREVDSAYSIVGGKISFRLGPYDTTKPLVIDPVLSYATYLGGSGFDSGHSIALDAAGNIYLAGETASTAFPTRTAYQPNLRGQRDAFVLKLNAAGTAILYSTFLGGSQDDSGLGIALGPSGNVYVTGATQSPDFPVTTGAYQTTYRGQGEAFVAKLDTGGRLVYASYLGGSGTDTATAIAADASGSAFVTGYTSSVNFPTTSGAVQTAYKGGYNDVFVTRFSPTGASVTFSTLIGGTGNDTAQAIALDASGNCYIAGQTNSADFPAANAVQSSNFGGGDAFALKLNPTGSGLAYSTFLGGSSADAASGIEVDTAGNAYVTGVTASWDFPVTLGAYQSSYAGLYDIFVTKLSPSGTSLVYSTYLGGTGSEQATGIAVDSQGQAWVTGYTNSINFPIQSAIQQSCAGSFDAVLFVLTASGSQLTYSSYIGGTGDDRAGGIAIDGKGGAYLTGSTSSTDLLTTSGVLQPKLAGSYDAFIMKFALSQPSAPLAPAPVSVMPSSGSGTAQQFTFTWSDTNGFMDMSTVAVLMNTSLDGLGACFFLVDPVHRSFLFADDSGSNFSQLGLGAAESLQNSQCVLNTAGSTLTGSGNTLTLVVSVNFKTAFAGTKSTFMWAQNAAGAANWQNMGSWTIPSNSPSLSIAESHTGNFTQGQQNATYAVTVSNANGAGTSIGAVTVTEAVPAGLTLVSMAGQGWSCSSNVCTRNDALTGGASYPSITVTVNVVPSAASPQINQVGVSGGGSASANASDSTVINAMSSGPTAVSAIPSSGTSATRQFTFTWSDPKGYADINAAAVLFNASINGQGACFFIVDPVHRTFMFADDGGSNFNVLGIGAVGSLQNSQCVLNTGSAALTGLGNNLALAVTITFKPSFAGTRSIFMWVSNNAGTTNNWQTEGTWTVPGNAPLLSITKAHTGNFTQGQQDATYNVIVSNASGAGATVGTVTMTDTMPPGLTLVSMSGGGWNCSNNSCSRSDSLSGGASYPAITVTVNVAGNATTPQVNQASVSGGGSTGANASDPTVINGGTSVPKAVSVTPASGSGSTQQFTFVWSDANGFADITTVAVLINTSINGPGACFFLADPVHRSFMFADDSGSNFTGMAIGASGLLQNSQCVLYGSGSTITGSGSDLTLTVTLNFKPAFAGGKSMFAWIQNAAGTANWQTLGSWIVP